MTTVLVTGGAGFVGSHFARAAHDAGLRVVAVDNLSTAPYWPRLPEAIECIEGDIGDKDLVARLVVSRSVDAIAHFAGRTRVDESLRNPALYFEQNLARTLTLLDAATGACARGLTCILSSSAAVYGQVLPRVPITESAEAQPITPYGASKLAAEVVLSAYGHARGVRWAALRYFNAAGAHPDGSLREAHDPETHLVPLAIDAALGNRPPLIIHGLDYATRDGTCVRDYVHVMDLAEAHLAALEALDRGVVVGAVNLGSARGHTVLEVLAAVADAVGCRVPHVKGPKREGDPPELVASVERAAARICWRPRRSMEEIAEDALRSRRG